MSIQFLENPRVRIASDVQARLTWCAVASDKRAIQASRLRKRLVSM